MSRVEENYQRWLDSPHLTAEEKNELKKMSPTLKEDAFFKDLEFGTAGMRGILGLGTNRLNIYTLRKACAAFAIYLLEVVENARNKGVVIAHDNRHMGVAFQDECAQVLNSFGIKAYIFDTLRPTPELSFAVRYFGAAGGIMITASHNPKEYNGFKVYDEHGCQIVPRKIARMLQILADMPNELELGFPHTGEPNETVLIDNRIDTDYLELVKLIQLKPELEKKKFKIVFSPQHGTSYVNAMRLFDELGYDVYPVLSQCKPDPDFSHTLSPNPEDPRSFIEAIKLAKEIEAQLIVMNDPDGDRVGLAYRDHHGEYALVNGNISAAMLLDYIIRTRKDQGSMPANPIVYNTIVSSDIAKNICKHYGVAHKAFLTGFKYIGEAIEEDLEKKGPTFLFGYEESYGCLLAPFVRDKDGIQAILMYCEMALDYFHQGLDLGQAYERLQEKVGYFLDTAYSIEFKGPEGQSEMEAIIQQLKENPLKELDGRIVTIYEDYDNLIYYDFTKQSKGKLHLDQSPVIRMHFSDGSYLAIRPSGTEPKCKFYVGIVSKTPDGLLNKDQEMFASIKKTLRI